MSSLYFHIGVPGISLPIKRVLGRVLIQPFPPDGIVVEVERDIGEDGVAGGGGQRVGVGLGVGSGRDAEEALFGVDRVETSILADAHPGDVVADAPGLIAFFLIDLRRDQHGKVGLSAGRRESGGHIAGIALRVLDAENHHMLGHPSFGLCLVGSDAQRKALLAHQRVAAVARIDRPDGVVFGEMAEVALGGIQLGLGMQAADPVVRLPQLIEGALARAGHDKHRKGDVDRIGHLNADFGGG